MFINQNTHGRNIEANASPLTRNNGANFLALQFNNSLSNSHSGAKESQPQNIDNMISKLIQQLGSNVAQKEASPVNSATFPAGSEAFNEPSRSEQAFNELVAQTESGLLTSHGSLFSISDDKSQNALDNVFDSSKQAGDEARIYGTIKVGDGSGRASEGDTAVLFSPARVGAGTLETVTLTREDALNINHGKAVPINSEQHEKALEHFGFIVGGDDTVRMSDKDGDGKISAGDKALLTSPSRQEHRNEVVSTLSESDATAIREAKGSGVSLSDTQKFNISKEFSALPTNASFTVNDKDGNNTLSVGDELKITGGTNENGELVSRTLSADDVVNINKPDDSAQRRELAQKVDVRTTDDSLKEVIPEVVDELAKLPVNVLKDLINSDENVEIVITGDSILDYKPEYKGKFPSNSNIPYDNLPGVTELFTTGDEETGLVNHAEVILTTTGKPGDKSISKAAPYNVALHELGAAHDWVSLNSQSDNFQNARNSDIASGDLSDNSLGEQSFPAWRETYATSFATAFGDTGSVTNNTPALTEYFKNNVGERSSTTSTDSFFGKELNLTASDQTQLINEFVNPRGESADFARAFDFDQNGSLSEGDFASFYSVKNGEVNTELLNLLSDTPD